MIRVAVLTISDSCAAGRRPDASGPAVADLCAAQGWTIACRETLPDDAPVISRRLAALAGEVDIIFTTGGTGIAERDVTPEATRAVLEKELPGLAELMRSEGLRHTRRAVLSRAVAGTRGRCLLVNLPGSPRGAVQSLNAILDLAPHIVELLRGNTAHPEGS
jgi:molybdenum cofactor synthesis domain-containing protein